jgi:hypothetical protein
VAGCYAPIFHAGSAASRFLMIVEGKISSESQLAEIAHVFYVF